MKEIVVISGKGGTGKTSVVGSFAVLAENKIMADCDVDAANLYLMLSPEIKEKNDFYSLPKAHIDVNKCTECGLCEEYCRFGAIKNNYIDPVSCEGCAVCSHICPEGAIEMVDTVAGEWYKSSTKYGPLVHARLGIAQENSGKLVAVVREQAKHMAEQNSHELIITDGPPGIGCPVIASLGGASVCLIITEPTLSGLHDMERTLDLADFFDIPAMVCVNKWDINKENTHKIEETCKKREVPFAGTISYDSSVIEAANQGKPIIEMKSNIGEEISRLWQNVYNNL
ncbi:MAG: ATP-binding protein [Clostridiales bacterium]|nr:ATP-binding protein [Clostridiales bacterium]MCF8022091.1 ATP-binding protein [Clostridiales bacterium]